MAKASVSRNASVPVPALPPKRASISRSEVTDIDGFMAEFGIKDRRTANKILKALGLPFDPIAGIVLISGEAFCKAVQNRGGLDS